MDGGYSIDREVLAAAVELPALAAELDRAGTARARDHVRIAAHPLFVASWRNACHQQYLLLDRHRVTLVFVLPTAGGEGPQEPRPAFDAGRTAVVPPGVTARLSTASDTLQLAACFPAAYVRGTKERAGVVGQFVDDQGLRRLGLALHDCLRRSTELDDVESRAWATLLGAYVGRHYAGAHVVPHAPSPATAPPCVHAALRQLAVDAETRWTVDKLAEIVGTSRTTLSRSFKAATGLSPHRYIVEQRVERARELLSTTRLPLLEVAYSVGFSSQSHMTETFRRSLGMTPREYRETAHG